MHKPGSAGAPRLAIVFLTIFLDLLGFGLLVPVLPYYAEHFHASESQIAMLGASFSLMQLIFVPLWGSLSDRIGRRPVILASVLGTAVAMVLFGSATSLLTLFLARLAHGAMTANIATVQAYIADSTDEKSRAKGMGIIGVSFGLGFIIGPFIGGQLAELGKATGWGYGLVGYGAAALSLVNFVLAAALLKESLPEEARATREPKKRSRVADLRTTFGIAGLPSLFTVYFISIAAFSVMEWTFALLTMERLGWTEEAGGVRYNSYTFVGVGLTAAIVQGGLIGRLVSRFGERTLVIAGTICMAGGMAVFSVVHDVPPMLAGSFLLAVGNSLSSPTLSSLVSKRSTPALHGRVLGAQQSVGALARVVGPFIGGLVFEHLGSLTAYLGCSALLLVACSAMRFVARDPMFGAEAR